MVRGCQRRVIFLKNTNSRVFSEAYFIIDDRTITRGMSEADMVTEANRIINESLAARADISEPRTTVSRALNFVLRHLPAFLIGVGCTLLFTFIF
jgi:hypothetical protein